VLAGAMYSIEGTIADPLHNPKVRAVIRSTNPYHSTGSWFNTNTSLHRQPTTGYCTNKPYAYILNRNYF
jgi:hypothetical protein